MLKSFGKMIKAMKYKDITYSLNMKINNNYRTILRNPYSLFLKVNRKFCSEIETNIHFELRTELERELYKHIKN